MAAAGAVGAAAAAAAAAAVAVAAAAVAAAAAAAAAAVEEERCAQIGVCVRHPAKPSRTRGLALGCQCDDAVASLCAGVCADTGANVYRCDRETLRAPATHVSRSSRMLALRSALLCL